MVALLVGVILTAAAVPITKSASNTLQLRSVGTSLTSGILNTRYRAIMNSHVLTFTLTTPANTYVVTDVTTGVAATAIPIPGQSVTINGGVGTYTFTFCPNGMVYGAGGVCPGNTAPPALTATTNGKQLNLTVSGVGNVTTTSN